MRKKILNYVIIVAISICTIAQSLSITQASILSDAKKAKASAQSKLDDVNEEISEIEKEQEELQAEIDSLDEELVQMLIDMDIIKDEISEKKAEIVEAQDNYAEAKAEEEVQYNAMKLRIQYMYENGDTDFVTALLTSTDFSDILNRSEMSSEVYKYDREQLEEFIAARQKVQDILEEIEEEKQELEENEIAYIEQQQELEKTLEEKRKKSDDFDTKLSDAKELASKYKKTIEKQNKIISQQTTSSSTSSSSSGTYTATGSGTGTDVANYALQFVGNPYVYGGTSLTNGADCSGFVMSVYAHFGVSLPHSSKSLRSVGYAVSSPQPGDIICYSGHCAIYIGDGKIVHASTPSTGIKVSNNWNYKTVLAIRRIF